MGSLCSQVSLQICSHTTLSPVQGEALLGKCGEEREGCVEEAEVQDSTLVLKAIAPTQPQFSYRNLVLIFLFLTGTNEKHYGGAIYILRVL